MAASRSGPSGILGTAGRRADRLFALVPVALLTAALAGCAPPPSDHTDRDMTLLPRQPESADTDRLAKENAQFAAGLLRELSRAQEKNIFFSPHSISTAMAMVWAGSKAQTEEAIARTMRWSAGQDGTHDSFAAMANLLSPPRDDESGKLLYDWTSANRLWTSIRVLDPFNQRLTESYASDAQVLDFSDKQQAAEQINAWAEKWTRGHIDQIVKPEDLTDIRLVLTNAVYFKGTWVKPFPTDQTRDEPFVTSTGATVQVPMMHDKRRVDYVAGDGYRAVSLPYKGGVSCMLILPDESGMDQLIMGLSAESLGGMRADMRPAEVRLAIPKLSVQTRFSAKEPLQAMGMGIAFSPAADFSGITTAEPLAISDVFHAATIDLDEVGTIATAVTAISVEVTSATPGGVIEFRLDRPYVLVITHEATGEVLFLGRINNPASRS